jgi:nucleoside-specific outer membrane channel protein Tsx
MVTLLCATMGLRAAADEGQGAGPADGKSVQSPAGSPQGTVPSFKPPTFADDTVTYVFGPAYRNPFITTPSQPDGADISRHAVEVKHVDAWKYGHNLIEVIIKKSSDVEPAAGGGTGTLGLYSIFRSGVGINRIAGAPVIALGPLRDIDIQAGMNLETKNSEYAPQERTLYFGPNLQFRFGAGFLNVGLHLRKEWNHNGNLGKNESYDVGFNIEPVWHFPFRLGPARLAFDGFADYNSPKGKDAAGHDTRAEFIARPQLKLDISSVVGQQAHVLELGVGFEYWHNMFGKDADRVPGARQFTPVFTLAVHLPLGSSGH